MHIVCKQESQTRHTSLCCIIIHKDKITNGSLQGHTLGYRSIVPEQDTDTFDDISEPQIYVFQDIAF